ncbi:uncharacterized protein LOC143252584 isoform X1 [Tachypleus tridentatus]|uniref:uncharacterized protein LOC143252584 isoform X1 n=2 Tax=Tachypleus tridentatus TaxID=6853 RepID=UPI003FCFF434
MSEKPCNDEVHDECDVCEGYHDTSECPLLGVGAKVEDKQIPSRARLTIPHNLQVNDRDYGCLKVIAKERIVSKTQFGPVEAPRVSNLDKVPSFILKVFNKDGTSIFLNTSDETYCNWMCLVSPVKDGIHQNLIAYQLQDNIYFSAQRDINVGEELCVGYAPAYGKKIELALQQSDSVSPLKNKIQVSHSNDTSNGVHENFNTDVQQVTQPPPKRKRGRPPKSVSLQRNKAGNDTNQIDIDTEPATVLSNLDAKDLGVKTDLKEWSCSQCGKHFIDCLLFARHLQEHYKPKHFTKDREGWHAGSWWRRRRGRQRRSHFAKLAGLRRVGRPRREEPKPYRKEQVQVQAEEYGNQISDSPQQDSVIKNQNGDEQYITKTVELKPQKVPAKRGRKRKGESILKEEPVDDKRFKPVHRQRSSAASGKYNLRKTRKALVVSEEDSEDSDALFIDEGSDEDDGDYDSLFDDEDDFDDFEYEMYERARPSEEIRTISKDTPIIHRIEVEHRKSASPTTLPKTKDPTSMDVSEVSQILTAMATGQHLQHEGSNVCGPLPTMPVIHVEKSCERTADMCNSSDVIEISKSISTTEIKATEKDRKTEDMVGEVSLSENRLSSDLQQLGSISDSMDQSENQPSSNNQQLDSLTARVQQRDDDTKQCGSVTQPGNKSAGEIYHLDTKASTTSQLDNQQFYTVSHDVSHLENELISSIGNVSNRTAQSNKKKFSDTQKQNLDESTEKSELHIIRVEKPKNTTVYAKISESQNENLYPNNSVTETDETVKDYRNIEEDLVILHVHRKEEKYKCDLCGKRFNKTIYLYRHLKKHTGEFTCHRCYKVFARKENMIKHNCPVLIDADSFQDQKFEFNCEKCNKSFGSKHFLRRHMARHTGEYRCEDCGKNYSSREILQNHACSMNLSLEHFVCGVCGKTFSRRIYLLKHLPIHTGQHACNICGKWLRSVDSLTSHLRMCSQVKEIENSGQVTCQECHQEFTDVAEFRKHQYEHTHRYACEECGARFRNMVSLGLHVCQSQAVSCEICNKICPNPASLQRHRAIHGEPTFKCNECGRLYYRKDSLQRHPCMLRKSSRKRKKRKISMAPLVCEVCGSMFSSTSSLNVHKNLHGEKKFSCEVCGKRFHRKDLLLEHHAVHSEPSFPCPTCGKFYKTKKSLDVHMLIHEGLKRFKCSVCNKEFFQKGNLLKHQETHNKDKKYSCTFCFKSFNTKEYFNIHTLEHTRGRIFTCEMCGKAFVKKHQLSNHIKFFHSNQSYMCKYCGICVKLRHSLKRHLYNKHPEYAHEFEDNNFTNSMLVSQGSLDMHVEGTAETPTLSTTQGDELLLAVAGVASKELQEAISSGRAQIKPGAAPNTYEISVPIFSPTDGTEENQHVIIATVERSNSEEGQYQLMNENNVEEEAYQVMEEEKCPGENVPVTPVNDVSTRSETEAVAVKQDDTQDNRQSEENTMMVQVTKYMGIPVSSGELQEEAAIELEEKVESQMSKNIEEAKAHLIENVPSKLVFKESDGSHEIHLHSNGSDPSQLVSIINEAHEHQNLIQVASDQLESVSESSQFQERTVELMDSNPHLKTGRVELVSNDIEQSLLSESVEQMATHLVDGQQIFIAEGTHHIVFDTSNFEEAIQEGQNLEATNGTIVLEDGTVLQHGETDEGGNLLFYVLTTDEEMQQNQCGWGDG